ncbi:MAG TPA: YggS family pyridoxal phosphate-dependent enzyme [Burkholderiales bacterium]|nr:YggS family pyridoxal phosphate-dependent enzyme [Burkholderiales bacterium]
MSSIAANLQAVKERIESAVHAAGRPAGSVRLVAVSKTFPPEAVQDAAQAGQCDFGENYAQEGVGKIDDLRALGLTWHYIGPIQSNKTRVIAEHFDWVHSIDRAKIAARLSEARDPGLPEMQVCIQVNVSGEASKSGVMPEEVAALARQVAGFSRMKLRGLMAVPEPTPDEALQRRRFAQLRELRDRLNGKGFAMDTLSMGMSADLEAAIAEGATIVRVGTAIFGERTAT